MKQKKQDRIIIFSEALVTPAMENREAILFRTKPGNHMFKFFHQTGVTGQLTNHCPGSITGLHAWIQFIYNKSDRISILMYSPDIRPTCSLVTENL